MHPTDRPRAHISIHDVAPDTLDRVRTMLSRLEASGVMRVMLLVIPGLEWSEEDLAQLRDWQGRGHPLAGHGWVHRVERRKTLFHKVHGTLISRYVAEHLSLGNGEIVDLMRRCYDWFGENGLIPPRHYVPPAWALGSLSRVEMHTLPFDSVETLRGVFFTREDRFQVMPLLGYEADTPLRAAFLKGFNRWNTHRAKRAELTRISLHPYDLELRLGEEILRDLRKFRIQAAFNPAEAGDD